MDEHTFEYEDDLGVIRTWDVRRLWKLTAGIPPKHVPILTFKDKIDLWLKRDTKDQRVRSGQVNLYLDDFDRIRNADLKYPIIVMQNGLFIMDGMHRLMKAWLSGSDTVYVVQFKTDPEPDRTTGTIPRPHSSKW